MYIKEAVRLIKYCGAFEIANNILQKEELIDGDINIESEINLEHKINLKPKINIEPKINLKSEPNVINIATGKTDIIDKQLQTEAHIKNHDDEINSKQFEVMDSEQSVKHLLENLMQKTQATYGAVLTEENSHIFLTHEIMENQIVKLKEPVHIAGLNNVPKNVVRYVSRTKSEVIIEDKASTGFFCYDDYLNSKQEFSLVCAPLIFTNVFSGIVYLEAEEENCFTRRILGDISFYSSMLAAKRLSNNQGIALKTEDDLPLTKRELEVFKIIVKGNTNKQVGELLNISLSTVKTHLINIYSKLEIKNRVEAVEKAKEYDIL
jgi:DNA-binding CsgD family transcriptional regulator